MEYACASYTYNKTQDMKTIATLILVLFIGVASQAQNASGEVKIETMEMPITIVTHIEDVKLETEIKVARLYKRKYTREKKELSFTTQRDAAKMA